MKRFTTIFLSLAMAFATFGCRGDVETTDDSVKMELETPKIETGEEDLDLDPRTDEDLDIDTPAERDR